MDHKIDHRRVVFYGFSVLTITLLLAYSVSRYFDLKLPYGGSISRNAISNTALGEGGLLVIAIVTDDISSSLNSKFREDNSGLPPIELLSSSNSYRTAVSWMTVSEKLIVINLFPDVVSVLNKEELRSIILHEVAHVQLKHSQVRTIKQEIEADIYSATNGGNAKSIISGIKKLMLDEVETIERIRVLEQLI